MVDNMMRRILIFLKHNHEILDPNIMRWYRDNKTIKMTSAPTLDVPLIFDSSPRTYANNNLAALSAYVFEAKRAINFRSLVMMKRFDGMRDRYQGNFRENFTRKFPQVVSYESYDMTQGIISTLIN